VQTRLVCQQPSAGDVLAPGRPWLLNALRLAIHFRRGDIATNSRWSHRMFPPTYYTNLAKQITQVGESEAAAARGGGCLAALTF
jgi:hypothetical protein